MTVSAVANTLEPAALKKALRKLHLRPDINTDDFKRLKFLSNPKNWEQACERTRNWAEQKVNPATV